MKHKVKPIKQEGGITLIALIITIIVLVILAAVTLNSIFGSNIIGLATNGTINYAEEQQKELGMLNEVSDRLGEITGDTDKPMAPTITLSGTKGNNDIYTSNVTVTISINKGLEQTGTIKLHYKINDGEEQITEDDASFEVSEEGTTTITVWTENEKGNVSDKQEISFIINKTAPSSPTISLNGTEGENGYYITNVGVTINAGNASNVSSIKYKVEGANSIAETEQTGTTATFDITQDGTSTITAYIINTAGLTSETITQVVNKDTVAPSVATIAVSGEAGETSITVTANGEDATSGVASYIFQYSTTNEENSFTTMDTVDSTSNSCAFEYQGLASNTTYYLRVIVKDRAGHTTPSTAVPATTKKSGLSDTVLASNIGKYVDYTPTTGSFTSEGQYNGYSNQSFSTVTGLKWRILFADNNKLTLISDTTANTGFILQGANGYNNGVKLLNDACAAMYSNSDWATGRSVNIEDIEAESNTNLNDYSQEYSLSNKYYPNIFAKEKTGALNGTYGTELDLSNQSDWTTGYSRATTLTAISTGGSMHALTAIYDEPVYVELLGSMRYWVASRCTNFSSTSGSFCIRYVQYLSVQAVDLYTTSGTSNEFDVAILPVVEIDLTKVNVGLTGDGGESTPYSIEAK